MNILVIDARMLTPDQDYGSMQVFRLMQNLSSLSCEVSFVAVEPEAPARYMRQLEEAGIRVLQEASPGFSLEDHLREHGAQIDVLVLSRVEVADRYFEVARRLAPRARIIFNTEDLHFLREFRAAKLGRNMPMLKHALETRRKEIALASAADAVIVVSETEKDMLQLECPGARIHVIPRTQEIQRSDRPFRSREGVLFVGGFQHTPNLDAVRYFMGEIHPLLKEKIPSLNVFIVGSHPPEEIRAMASEHVNVTGRVPDMAPWFDRCRMSIAPLRYGAGVKGKVLDSMSRGVPVVATSLAVEGLPVRDGEHVRIADTPQDFCSAVASLYSDEALWRRLSERGLEMMAREFSVGAARGQLERLLLSLRA